MNEQRPERTYSPEEAARELHISEDLLNEVLPRVRQNSGKAVSQTITESELNQIVDLLNQPGQTPVSRER